MGYETIAALEQDFQGRMAQATDEQRPALERAMADAKVEFLSAQLAARDLQEARRAALEKYPVPEPLARMIQGSTAAEIEASVKEIHEAVQGLQVPQGEQQPDPQAQPQAEPQAIDPAVAAYGRPAVGGMPGSTPPRQPDRERELFQKVVGTGGGKHRDVNPAESSEYFNLRMKRALNEALNNKGVPIGLGRGVNPNQAVK